jgi:hypothetical protein
MGTLLTTFLRRRCHQSVLSDDGEIIGRKFGRAISDANQGEEARSSHQSSLPSSIVVLDAFEIGKSRVASKVDYYYKSTKDTSDQRYI